MKNFFEREGMRSEERTIHLASELSALQVNPQKKRLRNLSVVFCSKVFSRNVPDELR